MYSFRAPVCIPRVGILYFHRLYSREEKRSWATTKTLFKIVKSTEKGKNHGNRSLQTCLIYSFKIFIEKHKMVKEEHFCRATFLIFRFLLRDGALQSYTCFEMISQVDCYKRLSALIRKQMMECTVMV